MSHTSTHTTPMIFAKTLPNSSSFCWSGVCSSSSAASCTRDWMMPISVCMPVRQTTPMHAPLETVVEENSVLCLSWITESPRAAMTLESLSTACDSPVSWDCSTFIEMVFSLTTRMSAGTLSPTLTSTMSPGTRSSALTFSHSPLRRQKASSGTSFFKASSAASALDSCQTPTMAFKIRIVRMTRGSTYATQPSPAASSSK
mmetsp:Transcript_121644/g.326731  ORF Transcript_121644/g.326731 Transcript_121644/m.326731 type:complete len:201 (+) Transcript_121644:2563-3165(+)